MSALGRHLLELAELKVRIPSPGGIVRALDGVSLSLEQGKTLALVGESGSGKSMLCRALMGVLPGSVRPDAGTIFFRNRDLSLLAERELEEVRGRQIGIVLQNPLSSLNPVMTIGTQIAEPLRRHLQLPASTARDRAAELLAAVGIPSPRERCHCYPHQLSGGMRQRVAIAIAIACEPQLLIADEPTTALDVTVQAEILDLLGRLQREQNMAILLVSHDLGVVAGRAHDTAVMYAGKIVEYGPTASLFSRMRMPYTRALFEALPRLDAPPLQTLRAIGGQPPDLTAIPAGCRFAPRCGRAEARCHREEPPLRGDDDAHHHYACWFPLPPAGGVP
jgi:oligopeptide/dipeptide ABC transporter ATP-binding protein